MGGAASIHPHLLFHHHRLKDDYDKRERMVLIIMLDLWILLGACGIAAACIICGAFFLAWMGEIRKKERRLQIDCYSKLLNAITEVHISGDDEERLSIARLKLAMIVDQVNMIAGRDLLMHMNTLLELQNRGQAGKDRNRERAILQNLMFAIRREIGCRDYNRMKKENFSFKFYLPAAGSD